jgi:integrase
MTPEAHSYIISPSKASEYLFEAGRAANEAAARSVFADYVSRRSDNTLRRQRNDLAAFSAFLAEMGAPIGELGADPEAWRGITWGLVAGFQRWLLLGGYAVSTINGHISAVKVYAGLAAKAGTLESGELAMIKLVSGYGYKEVEKIDQKRTGAGTPTRKGIKKAQPVSITPAQAKALKSKRESPQGRRDRLLMCLLLDHGLRCGELAGLLAGNIDLKVGTLRFYRRKVSKWQTHKLTTATLQAARAYLADHKPAPGDQLLLGSFKSGELAGGMSIRAITRRVKDLGAAIGLPGLSAHDCRHYWATQAARNHTPMDRLQDAGGWSSLAMPGRYIESAKIANEGVNLGGI